MFAARISALDSVRCLGSMRGARNILAAALVACPATSPAFFSDVTAYVQQNQPPGVPPLELTGERTLPDVPEENYWFRRHLAVYRWVAGRVAGRDVVDMACGEGYGSDELARSA